MTAYYSDDHVTLLLGDTLDVLTGMPSGSVNCLVTSPPYYALRSYGVDGQYGLEATPAAYVERMRQVFGEARRVLADDGTLWLNLGDSYASTAPVDQQRGQCGKRATDGHRTRADVVLGPGRNVDRPSKNLLGIPWRVAFALQDDGWILRNEIVWHKTNAMPESVRDRLSNRHEKLFLLTPNGRYHFDLDAIREPHTMRPQRRPRGHKERQKLGVFPAQTHSTSQREDPGVDGHPLGRNPGDVWSIPTRPYPEAHFAVFPIDLPLRCIRAGCKPGGVVLDPFSGSGTTGEAARHLGRRYIGIDLNAAYHDLAKQRFAQGAFAFDQPEPDQQRATEVDQLSYTRGLLEHHPELKEQEPPPTLFEVLAAIDEGGDAA